VDDEIVRLFELALVHSFAAGKAHHEDRKVLKSLLAHLAMVVTGFLNEVEVSLSDTHRLLVHFKKVEFV
jgi:hypothetical protein